MEKLFKKSEQKKELKSKYFGLIEELKKSEHTVSEIHELMNQLSSQFKETMFLESSWVIKVSNYGGFGSFRFSEWFLPDKKGGFMACPLDILLIVDPNNLKTDEIVLIHWIDKETKLRTYYGKVLNFIPNTNGVEIKDLYDEKKYKFNTGNVFGKVGDIITIDERKWSNIMNTYGYDKQNLIKHLNDRIIEEGKKDTINRSKRQEELNRRISILNKSD